MKNYINYITIILFFSSISMNAQTPSLSSVVKEAIDFSNGGKSGVVHFVFFNFTVEKGKTIYKNKDIEYFSIEKATNKLKTVEYLYNNASPVIQVGGKISKEGQSSFTLKSNSSSIANSANVDILTLSIKPDRNLPINLGIRNNAEVREIKPPTTIDNGIVDKEYSITSTVDGMEVSFNFRFVIIPFG